MKKPIKIILAIIVVIAVVVSGFGFFTYIRIKNADFPDGFTITAHTGCEKTEDNSREAIRRGYDTRAWSWGRQHYLA